MCLVEIRLCKLILRGGKDPCKLDLSLRLYLLFSVTLYHQYQPLRLQIFELQIWGFWKYSEHESDVEMSFLRSLCLKRLTEM